MITKRDIIFYTIGLFLGALFTSFSSSCHADTTEINFYDVNSGYVIVELCEHHECISELWVNDLLDSDQFDKWVDKVTDELEKYNE